MNPSALSPPAVDPLRAELERIDLLLRLQSLRARQAAGDDALRGLTISEEEVESLFLRPLGSPHWSTAPEAPELEQQAARLAEKLTQQRAASIQSGTPPRLWALLPRFGLTDFDFDVLLLALAPEVDLRYERLFAYLNDDVTRRRPGVDTTLGLFCATFEERLAARARFAPTAPLRRHGLLHLFAEPPQGHPTLLGSAFKLDGRLVEWVLDSDAPDSRLAAHAQLVTPRPDLQGTPLPEALVARVAQPDPAGELIYLQGPSGSAPQDTAEALCATLGKRLLVLDGPSLSPLPGPEAEEVVRLTLREALLQDAVPYWRDLDMPSSETETRSSRTVPLRALENTSGWVLLSGEAPWEPEGSLRSRHFLLLEQTYPEPRERTRLWKKALAEPPQAAEDTDTLARLASRYHLTPGQIQHAAAKARALASAREPSQRQVTPVDLAEACRPRTGLPRSSLARRLSIQNTWEDLVLPEEQLARLREICDHARYRELVLDEWGFDRKLSTGKGLNLLFTGPPGTGKTLTAGIMAKELGVELYQIDLSSVVSKYIGETEKHLARLFSEAEESGTALFFDEADALFGKRSEVKDSHDRYANLETSFLLQRIEAYEGMVILASNFSRNLDEAFLRRFQFIIEYSLPDERQRRRLWEGIWPAGVPRAADVDLGFLAQRFELSGGHIRNIALAAAFLAAASTGKVSQKHLLHATRREYQKLGRRVDEALFRP
ncbi:ATP-binding protein [Stigmatella sp. ncwal1]|uniref:ATP-binding protein n=1 Tax=Stigmatella ashevillensis TaxID=2995309 RepID=A0ABT5DIE4_9BACT|nr:ATP-binding protein [Stigmatella ashevillena]MDC0713301.1 ATP-binding protein [Stigmatella ashevillena]